MGGCKAPSMIVAGIRARFPSLAALVGFQKALPKLKPDVVASFTGPSTDQRVWVSVGKQLGVDFSPEIAPSETEWWDALKNRTALIPLDKLTSYIVHAASQGRRDECTQAATLAGIALTTLFGAVRAYKECACCVIVIADLQKDWKQVPDQLAKILRSNDTLGGAMQSVNKRHPPVWSHGSLRCK
jgi:hypothetical protein